MEYKLLILVLCVFTLLQVHVAKSTTCSVVKLAVETINSTMIKIQSTKSKFDEESAAPISAFEALKTEINKYWWVALPHGCEDAETIDNIANLTNKIKSYQTAFSHVAGLNKSVADLIAQYNIECEKDGTANISPDLDTKINGLLNTISQTSAGLSGILQRYVDDKVEANTKKWSTKIFSCLLEDKHQHILIVITAFNDTLHSNNHLVELQKSSLNNTLSSMLYEFQYASEEMKSFAATHGKHDLSTCISKINTNVTGRVEQLAGSCYDAFKPIAKEFSEYCDNDVVSEYKNIDKELKACQDINCTDTSLTKVDTLQKAVVNKTNNYNELNITRVINEKIEDEKTKFRKEVNSTLECIMETIASSGSVNFLHLKLALFYGLFFVFSSYLVRN